MVRLVLAAESRVSVPFSLVQWYSCAVLYDLPFFVFLFPAPGLPRSPSLTLRIMFFSWVFLFPLSRHLLVHLDIYDT